MRSGGFGEQAEMPLRLRDFYCRAHELPEEKFADHFLRRVLHPNANVIYPLVRLAVPDFDKDDRELISDLGVCESLDDVHRILGRLPNYYERWKRWRLKFRLRISSRRVLEHISALRLARRIRPSA